MSDIHRQPRVIACITAVALAIALPAFGQAQRIDRGSASLTTYAFHWDTHLSPPTPPLASSFGTAYDQTAPNLVHRMLLDRAQRVYFGYTVRIEPLTDATSFRVTFQPLTLTAALRQQLGDDPSSWKPLPAPRFPGPQTIRTGVVLELSLLSNETWGQQLREYVTVQELNRLQGFQKLGRTAREFSFAPGSVRDFTVDDASLRLQDPRVFINGNLEESSTRTLGDELGSVVWIYLPNRGRFLFSLVPNAGHGFRRAGEIRGSSLRFTIGADVYSVNSASPIAPGESAYNLYVLHQPEWRPSYAHANVEAAITGAAERVEYALAQ
jgi:hypothetical protein